VRILSHYRKDYRNRGFVFRGATPHSGHVGGPSYPWIRAPFGFCAMNRARCSATDFTMSTRSRPMNLWSSLAMGSRRQRGEGIAAHTLLPTPFTKIPHQASSGRN
jgi:hypothetical protein